MTENDVSRTANDISSHCVFKVKKGEEGNIKLKDRTVLHGNRDADKEKLRKDCSAADMIVIRMTL